MDTSPRDETCVLDDMEIARWLEKTSRTFALAIPMLAGPLRREISIAYLLFRVADTIEDGLGAPAAKLHLMESFRAAVNHAGDDQQMHHFVLEAKAFANGHSYPDYELLACADRVIATLHRSDPATQDAVLHHLSRSIDGMVDFIESERDDGSITIESLSDLSNYCYHVAGIVGEMLTELFLYRCPPLRSIRDRLDPLAARFGEGLQLVNILKDQPCDQRRKRQFIPPGVPQQLIIARAHACLEDAERYTSLLDTAGAGLGIIPFTQFPVYLAQRTLQTLPDMVEPIEKLTRAEVLRVAMHFSGARATAH